jgi:hypothetical protein
MNREDFEKLKEKEKAHLREIQKLKQRLREAKRVRSIGTALKDVEAAATLDELKDALEKVQLEALEGEAKLDMILDSGEAAQKEAELDTEEELSKVRAAELVKHMKMSMGLDDYGRPDDDPEAPEGVSKSVGRDRSEETDESNDEDEAEPDRPLGKSIGRMKPRDE